MKILALDLSTRSSGYCLGNQDGIISHGCITASSKDVVKRIIKMRDQISKIIKDNKTIDKIIIQEVRPEYNSHTNKVLMWLQAAVVIAAAQFSPVTQVSFVGASTWRSALRMKQGRGIKRDQVKKQDIQYVKEKYQITASNDDQADAICLFDSYWITNSDDNEINWGQ